MTYTVARMTLRIVMHEAFPPEDVEAVRDFARNWDEGAEVTASYGTKSATAVLIVLAFVGGAFGRGFFEEAGADSYHGLKKFVEGLRAKMRAESQLVLEDDEGLQLILGPATPAEALLELPEDVREAAGESGELYWDDDEQSWKSPF